MIFLCLRFSSQYSARSNQQGRGEQTPEESHAAERGDGRRSEVFVGSEKQVTFLLAPPRLAFDILYNRKYQVAEYSANVSLLLIDSTHQDSYRTMLLPAA